MCFFSPTKATTTTTTATTTSTTSPPPPPPPTTTTMPTTTTTTSTTATTTDESYVGRIKWFNSPRGYGFVTNVRTNEDFFVHHSGISVREECWKTLYPGEYVSYSLVVDAST